MRGERSIIVFFVFFRGAHADDDKNVEALISAGNLVNTEQRRMKNKKKTEFKSKLSKQ